MRPEANDISRVLGAIERREAPVGLRDRIMSACSEAGPVGAISCDECLELASAYLDDELDTPARDSFEAHVFSCEMCYFAFKRMERTAEVMRSAPAVAPPEDLHERITAAVARESGTASVFTWRRAAQVLGGLAAAAALLAAIFVPGGTDAPDAFAPMVAELPAETSVGVTTDTESVSEPVEPGEAADGSGEPAETVIDEMPGASRMVAHTTPRGSVGEPVRETAAPASPEIRSATTSQPTRTDSVDRAPDTAAADAPEDPRPRTEPSTPERTATDARPRPEPTTPGLRPEPEPVTTDDVPEPAPARESRPEVAPEPPARDPQPRESVIAAIPRDSDPEPVTASAPTRTSTASAPKPDPSHQPTRLAVVPRQPHTRTVYQPAPTPTAERSERLSRMAASINGSQNPRMDNPSSGIELN